MADVLAQVADALTLHFDQAPARASVSFLGVEPIEVLRFTEGVERVYVTLGMSRRPMTSPTATVVSDDGPRAELLLRLHDPADAFDAVWRRLAVLAAAPAVEGVIYRDDMTVDLGEAFAPGSRCTGAVLTGSGVPDIPVGGRAVAVLGLEPATSAELAWCRVRGATALRERWARAGTDLRDLARSGVALD